MTTKYLVSFATPEFYTANKRLITSAKHFGIDKYITYTKNDIVNTEFWNQNKTILTQKRGAGYWLWKPYVILKTLNEINENDYVIYSDSGIEIISDLNILFTLCHDNNGIFLINCGHQYNKTWTKRDCFILMDCDKRDYWESEQLTASFQIYQKNSYSIQFVQKWFEYCKNINILTDVPNICEKSNFGDFKDHRHDQSILSLLSKKCNIEIYRDPTQWGNYLKMPEYRIKGEFLHHDYSANYFSNSAYGTLLNHHRLKTKSMFSQEIDKFKLKLKSIIYIFKKILILLLPKEKTNDKCSFCNSDEISIFTKDKYWEIHYCKKCKNAWTSPPPNEVDYENKDFHFESGAQIIENLPSQWQKSLDLIINIIEKNISIEKHILEIGCGQGILLQKLNKLGYITEGIEPSISASKISKEKGIKTEKGYFPNENITGKYDLIVLNHVFEHVKDFKEFHLALNDHLNVGGFILFTQTNWRGLMPLLYRNNWYAWVPEDHYWHFSVKGLKMLFKENCWRVKTIKYSSLEHGGNIISRIALSIPSLGDQFHILFKKIN